MLQFGYESHTAKQLGKGDLTVNVEDDGDVVGFCHRTSTRNIGEKHIEGK